jgi:hypothetical protein
MTQKKLYTSVSKGGEYELVGTSAGAGKLKGLPVMIYRDTATGQMFHREPEEFATRMKAIEPKVDVAALLELNKHLLQALKAAREHVGPHNDDSNYSPAATEIIDEAIAKAGA